MATSRSEPTAGPSLRKDGPRRPPFRTVLVANRGEIAIRIMRACREMGMESVAVYSDADSAAGHVRYADRAVRIGPAAPSESYLRIQSIVEAALATGAEAVHPGYGFLAERADFARAVGDAGLTFVGPGPETIEAIGDKLHARRLARDVGVAIVPGTLEPASIDGSGIASMLAAAEAIGFPLLVKAAAGGGGRGMRRVVSARGLEEALRSGSREAASAFGDGAVYLEREIQPARHIEVQLLGDVRGQVVAIGERDCSLQRRHQKLVEESPAPGLGLGDRRRLHDLAVRVASAAQLRNAATAEFLRASDGAFYFLEVNTRLQVEHGVSELMSGIDIVREQFTLAAGEPLSGAALSAAARASEPIGHAIEVRLSAEDPARDFAPAPGMLTRWTMPAGPGVRVDTALQAGDNVPAEYDNLIAKIMVMAGNREEAVDRLRRALDETEVAGIQTTLPFHQFVARDASFRAGEISIGWVGEHWDGPAAFAAAARAAQIAAGLDAVGSAFPAPATSAPNGEVAPSSARASASDGPRESAAADGTASPWRAAGLAESVDRWPG